jgi:hypothetical protein
MSQGNACFSPLWQPAFIDIDCPQDGFKLVDPTTTSDLDDCIHEELQVFTSAAVAGQVGYLVAEYDISFQEPIYQPHSTALPLATGPGQRTTIGDNSAPAANDAVQWTATGLPAFGIGHVYRIVIDIGGSSAPAGLTLANMWSTITTAHATTTTFAALSNQNLPVVGGFTVYGVMNPSGLMHLYVSLEAAVTGSGTGQIYYRFASLGTGTYTVDAQTVRIGITSFPSVQ